MSLDSDCSVLIRCLNEEQHLPVLLTAIRRQTLQPREIIMVDSGSTDRSIEIALSYGARVLHIVKEQFSFGKSLNVGFEAAESPYVVIASAHVYPVHERWLELLVENFDADTAVALVYGGQTGDHRTNFSERQIFKQWFPPVSSSDQAHSFCNNANAAVRREVWEKLRYDEQVPGLEDVHWAKRAIERGLKITYRADATVAHVHEESYRQVYRRYRREAIGLRTVFPWEGMTLLQVVSLYAGAVRADLKQARREGILARVLGSVFRFRASQYWGAYRGLNGRHFMTSELRTRLYYPSSHEEKAETAAAVATPPRPAAQKDVD